MWMLRPAADELRTVIEKAQHVRDAQLMIERHSGGIPATSRPRKEIIWVSETVLYSSYECPSPLLTEAAADVASTSSSDKR